MNTLTDELLIERICQGQSDALDILHTRYAKRLYVFCFNSLHSKNPQQSEDLVQDVFLRVIKAVHNFDPQKATFRTWLFSIARNRCIDANRRRAIINFISIGRSRGQDDAGELIPEETFVAQDEDVEESVIRASVIEAVRECIAELENEDERQAIVLYYLGGKVYREIGDILGKSTSMARNRVESARDKVKRCLERKGINSYS